MKTGWSFIILVLVAGANPACSKQDSEGPARKNILLIVADTLRADHLGCYGYEQNTSPHIDSLAAKGTLFTEYYTVVPTTLASFTSLLTSLHPKDHGAYRNGKRADESLPILGERFRSAGFETAAFIACYCLSDFFGMARGFDHFDEQYTSNTILEDNSLIRSAESVTEGFITWAKSRDQGKPFFAMVHFFDPHWPYDPPAEMMDLFGAERLPQKNNLPSLIVAKETLEASGGEPNDYVKKMHKLYLAEIRYVDTRVGKILTSLTQQGLMENTVIVFTADHGETFWDHDDYFDHGLYVYESTIHIPLIIHDPGTVPEQKQIDTLLCNLDLGPTLCNLAGFEPPREFQGRSFASLLLNKQEKSLPDRPIFSEATKPMDVEKDALRPNLKKAKCIRQGPWKYITFPASQSNRRELYNVIEDPFERNNLINDPRHAALVKELQAALQAWAIDFRALRNNPDETDPEVIKKLRELGY
ncbi:MAG: sulfatase-like hydrolase/transferase [Planctomycetes bacterium]|nr:sulfatase-like hydrolase/transferase [Planctomycetota bacterium]